MSLAIRARNHAEAWRAKVERARGLAAKYPEGQPGPRPDDEQLAGDVAFALSEWENRPEVRFLWESLRSHSSGNRGVAPDAIRRPGPTIEIVDAKGA